MDMVIFHIHKCTRIPVDLHRYEVRSYINTVLSRIDVNSRPICTNHSRIDMYHRKECGVG